MHHKKNKFNNDKFARKVFERRETKELKIEHITKNTVGDSVSTKGIIDSIAQTSGPTLFTLTDGTGNLVLKGFESPGERAYPEIKEGDSVQVIVQINEFNNSLEGEIKKISKLSDADAKHLEKQIEETEREKSKPVIVPFMIKSPILEKLKESYIKAATEIRLAIFQNRPIIIRHHNDADGYSSGFALERAILPLIEKQHGPGKAAWEFYTRAPCAAPFYEIDDSIRDTASSLRNQAKFSNKMPLIIISDNGSSPEDLMAIKQGRIHGIQFIVVDHHFFDEDVISAEVLVHINPFLVGEDGAAFSAGMLCAELARFINGSVNVNQIPAMAAIADRIDLMNPQAVHDYLKIAEKEGYTKELLHDIIRVIDFVSAKLKFMEAREYIEVLFGEPRDKQKNLVKLMSPYIANLEKKGLEIAKSAAKIEKIGKTNLQILPIEDTFPGFGFYPKPGKVVGLLHDYAKEHKKITSLVSIGLLSSAITIRATDEANFSVHELITYLNKELPESFVESGGHKNAGSITFIPNKKDKVLELLKKFILKR